MQVSIVIRTLNEKERLIELLEVLKAQTYQDFDIIVVDNESTDGTPETAMAHGAQVIKIQRDKFTFPRSMNEGMEAAKGEIVVLLVGHAIPFRKDWLESCIKDFQDSDVAGVYSPVIPHKKSSLAEKIYYWPGYIIAKIRGPHNIRKMRTGVFGATNIAIRKSVWEKHRFDEKYELGGEDGQWAAWALAHGYKIVCDYHFAVRHSHMLGLRGLIRQIKYWKKLGNKTKFNRKDLQFRKDIKF